MAPTVISPVLVGRTDELAAFRTAYERSRSGESATVLISGEAGIGKSRLVTAATEQLPGDPLVLTGGCLELGADGAPWVPFVSVLRGLLREWGADRLRAELPADGTALAQWWPELALREVAGGQVRLYEEVLALLDRAARNRPVVVLIEDLQWSDASSRELFVYLARNLAHRAVLLVGTIRSGELAPGHPTRQLLRELGRRAEVTRLELGPLGRREIGALLAAIDQQPADPLISSEIYRRSGGNPLFAEALQDASTTSAADLGTLLLDRVADLSPAAQQLLVTVCVASRGVTDELLSEVIGESIDEPLRELLDRNQVALRDDQYVVRHDLIREAVYASLLPGERRRLHGRFARAIADRLRVSRRQATSFHTSTESAVLAVHWFAAGEPRPALPAAWGAARAARRQAAYDEELNLVGRILAAWSEVDDAAELLGVSRSEVLTAAVEAAHAAGQAVLGVDYATAALADLDPTTEPQLVAWVLGLKGLLSNRIDNTGLEELSAAVDLVAPGSADDVRSRLLSWTAFVQCIDDDRSGALTAAEEALDLAERVDDDGLRAAALLPLGWVESRAGATTAALARYDQARVLATRAGDHQVALTASQWAGLALVQAGRRAEAADATRAAQQEAERVGLARSRGSILAQNRAYALFYLGRWDEALDVVDDALADAPPPRYAAVLRFVIAQIILRRGESARAEHLIAETEQMFGARRPAAFQPILAGLRVRLATQRADLDSAHQILQTGVHRILTSGPVLQYEASWLLLAGAHYQQTATKPSPELAKLRHTLTPAAALWPTVAAALTSFDATTTNTEAAWQTATTAWRNLQDPYELAWTLTGAATAALAAGNKPSARDALTEAHSIATDLRAQPLLTHLTTLSTRAGLPTDRPTPPPFGLTARERVVLQVLSRGLSNAQIARELYVSTNTIATHVARILRKLDVASRTEAVAVAHTHNLTPTNQTE